MNIQYELAKYKIFNSSRYFIKELITSYIERKNYLIRGGFPILNLFNSQILDKVKDTIEQNINSGLDYKFLLNQLYIENINILTDTYKNAKILGDKIKTSIHSDLYYRYIFVYLFNSISMYFNWNRERENITFTINNQITVDQGDILIKVSLYINNNYLGRNIKFGIVSIRVKGQGNIAKDQEIKNFYDVYIYEIKNLSDRLNNSRYIKSNKRYIARTFIFFNMFFNKSLLPLNVDDNSYIQMTDNDFINDFNKTFENICQIITKNSITVPIIRNNDENNFTIELSHDTLNYYNDLTVNNDINNLTHNNVFYYYNKSNENLIINNITHNENLIKRLGEIYDNLWLINHNRDIMTYYNILKEFDKNKLIYNYTDASYQSLNDYMTNRIYLNSYATDNEINNELQEINNILKNMSNHNKTLFNLDKKMYVWRGENNRIIGHFGSFYNVKVGDKIRSHTPISTSIFDPYNKKIILKIKIDVDKASAFAILTQHSKHPTESEVLLPYGSILEVTSTSYKNYYSDTVFLIEADYILFEDLSVEDHIKKYRDIELGSQNYSPANLIFSEIYATSLQYIPEIITPINATLITNTLNKYIPKNIETLDPNNPYEDFIKKHPEMNILYDPYTIYSEKFENKEKFNKNQNYTNKNYEQPIDENDHIIRSEFCRIENLDSFSETRKNFNLLTFNVNGFIKFCDTDFQQQYTLQFIQQLVQYTNVDIICLQEIIPTRRSDPDDPDDPEVDFSELVTFMEKLGYNHYSLANDNHDYTNFNKNYFIIGNAIFSKHKPIEVKCYGLLGNKCAIVHTIIYKDNVLNIINVRLGWNYGVQKNDNLDLNLYDTNSAIFQLEQILRKHKNYILMGDFNKLVYNSDSFINIRAMSKIISPPKPTSKDTGSYTSIYYDVKKVKDEDTKKLYYLKKRMVDFILISNNLSALFDIDSSYNDRIITDASSHYPVFASLKPKPNVNLYQMLNLNGKLYKELYKKLKNIYKDKQPQTINMYFTDKYLDYDDIQIYIVPDKYAYIAYPYYYYLPLVANGQYVENLINMINQFIVMGHTVNISKNNTINIYDDVYDIVIAKTSQQ